MTRIAAAAALASLALVSACTSAPEPAPQPSAAPTSAPVTLTAAGAPAAPDAATEAAYIAELAKVDKALVTNVKRAVDRSRNQCSSIADGRTDEQLVELTKERFSGGSVQLSSGQAAKALAAVRKYICPA